MDIPSPEELRLVLSAADRAFRRDAECRELRLWRQRSERLPVYRGGRPLRAGRPGPDLPRLPRGRFGWLFHREQRRPSRGVPQDVQVLLQARSHEDRDDPDLKIGRLAVDRRHQSRGVERLLIKHIAGMAIEVGRGTGIRLLILQAKPQSVPFYEKCGFQLTYEVKREKGRRNRTMFLDLYRVEGS